ncbi:MAG TPA: type IV toxin-antitoxin system AbiEi family antitoxin domain-containing protein [Acidimicrobiales bacterium]|nr:type IV toxin-antitoxin system AbiEi family antitoxin domain-containing protein [Acidimicrobiales bacterium]
MVTSAGQAVPVTPAEHPDVRLARRLRQTHGVLGGPDALALGFSAEQIQRRLAAGRWRPLHRGVYVVAGARVTPEARIFAACLAAGPVATASHRSAAWLHGLLRHPPDEITVTIPTRCRRRLAGVTTYRSDLEPRQRVSRRGIPTTSIVRTLDDLAAVAPASELDTAVDVALANGVVLRGALTAAVAGPAGGRRGRPGTKALRGALTRRGLVDPPAPSVLESRVRRLLTSWGITPLGCEVAVAGGRYRLDFQVVVGLALEVDGFTYHSSPEAKAYDAHRRNALRALGVVVVECDWVTALRRPDQLRDDLLAAFRLVGAPPPVSSSRRRSRRSPSSARRPSPAGNPSPGRRPSPAGRPSPGRRPQSSA